MKKRKKAAKRGAKKKEVDIEQVKKAAGMGLSKEEIGLSMGIGRSTFFTRLSENPEIEEAIKEGRATFKVFITQLLISQARSGNVTAAIWLDKTRCGTKETIGVNLNGRLDVDTTDIGEKLRAARERVNASRKRN